MVTETKNRKIIKPSNSTLNKKLLHHILGMTFRFKILVYYMANFKIKKINKICFYIKTMQIFKHDFFEIL